MVYRNGSSEGNFDAIAGVEFRAIRRALFDLRVDWHTHKNPSNDEETTPTLEPCPNGCQNNGCTFCCPPITLIVAITQHNIRIVPAEAIEKQGGRGRSLLNVPSGTCLDDTIPSYLDGENTAVSWPKEDGRPEQMQIFENSNSDGFDFALTAHGGLKGTSKPVLYRVVSSAN